MALRKGLTDVQARRLVGDSEEDLEANADELLATFASVQAESDTDLPSRPRERLRPGARPEATPDETDPAKLVEVVPRSAFWPTRLRRQAEPPRTRDTDTEVAAATRCSCIRGGTRCRTPSDVDVQTHSLPQLWELLGSLVPWDFRELEEWRFTGEQITVWGRLDPKGKGYVFKYPDDRAQLPDGIYGWLSGQIPDVVYAVETHRRCVDFLKKVAGAGQD